MMSGVNGKPPRKADQLLQALSKKYEEKVRDRETNSSGRNTPSRRTPRGSRERLPITSDASDHDTGRPSPFRSRSARESPIVSGELFSSRAPSLDGLRSGRRSNNGSPAVIASPGLFEKSPAVRSSPVQSPGLLEKARTSPAPSLSRRQSPSPSPASKQARDTSPVDTTQERSPRGRLRRASDTQPEHQKTERSHLFGRTSTPTEHSEHNHSMSEYDKSLEGNGHKTDDYDTELADLDTSHETSNTANIVDTSLDNSTHDSRPISKYPQTKYTYGSSLFGKSLRSPERGSTRDSSKPVDYKMADKSGSDPLLGPEERPESRHSSISSYSLSQPMATGSPRSSIGSLLPRNYALEKEQTDSQMRKLEVENSSLKMDNKSLKEKYNRAHSQIVHLETKVETLNEEINKVRDERKKGLSLSRQKNAEAEESLQESARGERDELRRKVDLLKVEKESLEQELAATRKMTDTAMQSSDISKVVSGYRVESSALRDELKALKGLLKEAESGLQKEADARQRMAQSNKKLTHMNNILKQQLDVDSGHSVADKQVKGIESRLKITEDRLFQERADRAGKLSEIEEKLLNENAKLHVDVKDLSRQLNREQERFRLSEVKLQELKEQQMSLNFLSQTSSSRSRFSPGRRIGENKKYSSEVAKVVETIQSESGTQLHEEEEVILYLYNKERAVMKQLNDWKNELTQLRDMHKQISNEKEMRKLVEELQDSKQLCTTVEIELNSQIGILVSEKHQSMAAVKSGEDKIEALETELDYLRVQLKVGGGFSSTDTSLTHFESEKVSELESELGSVRPRLGELERSLQASENELSCLQQQLNGKSASLDEAVEELDRLRNIHNSDGDENNKKQKQIFELNIEVKALQAELSSLKHKNELLSQAKTDLEAKVDSLTEEVDSAAASLRSSSRNAETFNAQNTELEQELGDKKEEVRVLKERYDVVESKHVQVKEELILSKETAEKLQHRANDLHQQLIAKSSENEDITSRLRSQENTYTDTEEHLLAAQKQIDELKTELSIENLNYNKLKSDAERDTATLKHQSSKLSREVATLTSTVDSLKGQKSELSKDVEVLKVKLAELQARLTEAQSSLTQHKDKEKMLSEERDRLTEEKHEAKLQMAKVESDHKQEVQELLRSAQEYKQQCTTLKTSMESTQTSSGFEKERITSELEATRKQLHKKEQEMEGLNELLMTGRREAEQKTARIKDLESLLDESNYKNREQVDELNEAIRQKDYQVHSYQSSLKELDSESKTKKELEVQLHSFELQLQEQRSAEQRLKNELSFAEERKTSDHLTIDGLKADAARAEKKQTAEVSRLKQSIDKSNEELKRCQHQYERERTTLQDKFNLVSSDLKAAEATIAVMRESKQTHLSSLNSMEKKKESLKAQLQDSQVNERLAEQRLSTVKEQLEETKAKMVKAEDKVTELTAAVVKAESEVKIEKEKLHYLTNEKEDLEGAKVSVDYKVEMSQREIETLQNENSSLREQLQSQKEILESRSKRLTEQQKMQIENYEKENTRLQLTNQDLGSSVERLKSQLGLSEETSQSQRHKMISIEQKLIETEAQLNKSEQTALSHDDIQDKLKKRNLDLELELSELKNLLTRMEGNSAANELASSKIDNLTRADLNRTMSEWSSRLQTLLENERSKQKSGDMDSGQSKIKMVELESRLKHEQLMHTVTKNQLKSLEDENMKLRKRILNGAGSRRAPSSRSKEEMIREQIIQSEMRVAAQIGLPTNRLLGTTLLNGSQSTKLSLNNTLNLSPSKLAVRGDNFSSANVLGSLGFTSMAPHGRLNNSLSPDNSMAHSLYHD